MNPRQLLSLFTRRFPLYLNRNLQRPLSSLHQPIAIASQARPRFQTKPLTPLFALTGLAAVASYSESGINDDEKNEFINAYEALSPSYQKVFKKLGLSAEETGAIVTFHKLLNDSPYNLYARLFDLPVYDEKEAFDNLARYLSHRDRFHVGQEKMWGSNKDTLAQLAAAYGPGYFKIGNGPDLLSSGRRYFCETMIKIAETLKLDVKNISYSDAILKIGGFISDKIKTGYTNIDSASRRNLCH